MYGPRGLSVVPVDLDSIPSLPVPTHSWLQSELLTTSILTLFPVSTETTCKESRLLSLKYKTGRFQQTIYGRFKRWNELKFISLSLQPLQFSFDNHDRPIGLGFRLSMVSQLIFSFWSIGTTCKLTVLRDVEVLVNICLPYTLSYRLSSNGVKLDPINSLVINMIFDFS